MKRPSVTEILKVNSYEHILSYITYLCKFSCFYCKYLTRLSLDLLIFDCLVAFFGSLIRTITSQRSSWWVLSSTTVYLIFIKLMNLCSGWFYDNGIPTLPSTSVLPLYGAKVRQQVERQLDSQEKPALRVQQDIRILWQYRRGRYSDLHKILTQLGILA